MLEYARVEIGPVSIVAFSRHGGKSAKPYESLNLGLHVGDQTQNVLDNWEIIKGHLAATKITYLQAEHGVKVNKIKQLAQAGQAPLGDGLVCSDQGHAIASLSADCVPFALVDPESKVIAVGHAGWKGVLANLMQELSNDFVESGARISNSTAVIGPSICGNCYEVEPARVDLFRGKNNDAISDENHLDLSSGVKSVLSNLGYKIEQIPGCNFEDENLFSYRRAGGIPTGRGALVAIIN